MYFAWSERFEVVWISDPDSLHSRNLVKSASAAVTVYASNQVWAGLIAASSCSAGPAFRQEKRRKRPGDCTAGDSAITTLRATAFRCIDSNRAA